MQTIYQTMDRHREPVVMTPVTVLKPEGKRLRRKLQKIGIQPQQQRSQITDCNDAKASKTNKSALKSNKYDTLPPAQPPFPVPLSDTQWLEYIRKSGYLSNGTKPPSSAPSKREMPSRRLPVIPELAHLRENDAIPRTSTDTSSSGASSSTAVPLSPSLATRRYAKTPVFSIGQLEQLSRRDQSRARKVSSVELIAESYRKLLESRCCLLRDSFTDLTSTIYDDHYETPVKRPRGSDIKTPASVLSSPTIPSGDMGSPTSDDGTLVGFEEDTIYFKPISFTPEPSPTLQHYASRETTSTSSEQIPDNPSLQICFDLLTRELSSAVSGSALRPSTETSALQIWVMIEAYEKLRDRVLDLRLDDDQTQPMMAMFDMWLQALYALHDNLLGNDDGQRSTSDYGDLMTEALD